MFRSVFLALLLPLPLMAALPDPGTIYVRQANDTSRWSYAADVEKLDRIDSDVEVCRRDGGIDYVLAALSKPTKAALLAAMKGPTLAAGAVDSLDEVNRQRASRGLRPYIRDEGLMKAAADCAAYRAANRIAGHTNDFAFVPPGSSASCAGCAAWQSGFGACEILGNWTYAGAAYVVGSDGLRYCQAFYR